MSIQMSTFAETEEKTPQILPEYSYQYKLVANADPKRFETQVQAALDAGFVPLSRLRLEGKEYVREFYKRIEVPAAGGPGQGPGQKRS